VVVTDIHNGRILSIVNQKLALKSGFQPCSTIKLVTALAALREGVIDSDTALRLNRTRWDLTKALARSNNGFFATLGVKLGFERVRHYARLFGLGERATLNLADEQPGQLPDAPPKNGGVGMMTSFGEGISLTPLELASLVGAIGNGGTLYYLQYPRNQMEARAMQPRIKRHLDIGSFLNDVKPGMRAAVEWGTARRASVEQEQPILGKTGTCTDYRQSSHMGWFGSFNDSGERKLAVVVMLTGAHGVSGPVASGIAGEVYRRLSQQGYFGASKAPVAMLSTGACCSAGMAR
jgi:cell division protein FtsI/penicillin-binding protein 2